MENLKILIVEDEAIPAFHLSETLVDCGYLITAVAANYEQGVRAFKKNIPDLVLLDINLGQDSKDGIQLAKTLNDLGQNIPLIYISANFDETYRRRAYRTAPANFLIKPYNRHQVEIAIEIALLSFHQPVESREVLAGHQHIFIKEKSIYVRLTVAEICAVEADRGLSHIFTVDKKRVVCTHLDHLLQQVPSDQLIRIHRSHAVNLKKITAINLFEGQVTVSLNNTARNFNIGPKYKEELTKRIKTIRTS